MRWVMIHAATMAAAVHAGIDPAAYVAETARHLSYRTATWLGDAGSRLLDMPGMTAHTGGYFAQPPDGGALMNMLELREGVRLLTHAPGEACSMLMRRALLPDTLATALEGRILADIVDHPATRVDGLVVQSVVAESHPHAGMLRLRLGRAAWHRIAVEE